MTDDETRLPGKTTIAPGVLLAIARLTTLNVEGVSRMSSVPGRVDRLFKKNYQHNEGVSIEVEDGTVYADLYVVLKSDISVREVSQAIQREVQRAIQDMVGMNVGGINIHVEDIDYPTETEA
jgi:uncharacterized alkaline shock family protein YloU